MSGKQQPSLPFFFVPFFLFLSLSLSLSLSFIFEESSLWRFRPNSAQRPALCSHTTMAQDALVSRLRPFFGDCFGALTAAACCALQAAEVRVRQAVPLSWQRDGETERKQRKRRGERTIARPK